MFFISIYQVPWILKWEDKIIRKTDKRILYLGKIFFGQWWKKFDDSGLSKRTIQIYLIRSSIDVSTVSKLISSIQKKKLHLEEKEKLKALFQESEGEDDIMNIASDSARIIILA